MFLKMWKFCLLSQLGHQHKISTGIMKSESVSRSVVSNSLGSRGLWPTRLLCPWNFPGKHTGVSSHSLLQEIFPTQGSNPGRLHCKQILYYLSHQGRHWPVEHTAITDPNLSCLVQPKCSSASVTIHSKHCFTAHFAFPNLYC